MADKRANLKPFKPGESGNPGGKPEGARNRITKRFLLELAEDFEAEAENGKTNGRTAIERMREDHPEKYVMACAALVPKEVSVEVKHNFVEALKELERIRRDGNAGLGAGLAEEPEQPASVRH